MRVPDLLGDGWPRPHLAGVDNGRRAGIEAGARMYDIEMAAAARAAQYRICADTTM